MKLIIWAIAIEVALSIILLIGNDLLGSLNYLSAAALLTAIYIEEKEKNYER